MGFNNILMYNSSDHYYTKESFVHLMPRVAVNPEKPGKYAAWNLHLTWVMPPVTANLVWFQMATSGINQNPRARHACEGFSCLDHLK